MATKNSGELAPGTSYTLGNYTLRTGSAYDSQTGKTDIVAYCRLEGEGPAKQGVKHISIDGEATIKSWYVEANEDTADVYVIYNISLGPDQEIIDMGLMDSRVEYFEYSYSSGGRFWPNIAVYSDYHARVSFDQTALNAQTISPITLSYYPAKDIFVGDIDLDGSSTTPDYGDVSTSVPPYDLIPQGHASRTVEETVFVARFSIDLHEAGGTGPESDWDDPGDWNEDPDTVLNLTIEGALSGRHNDYLFDPTFSYVPADNIAEADYGCGGDGGHGGGGGAGASTVVIRDFATNRANRVQDVAIAKRHGYGSGGGKGAKGGPGCILIYY